MLALRLAQLQSAGLELDEEIRAEHPALPASNLIRDSNLVALRPRYNAWVGIEFLHVLPLPVRVVTFERPRALCRVEATVLGRRHQSGVLDDPGHEPRRAKRLPHVI